MESVLCSECRDRESINRWADRLSRQLAETQDMLDANAKASVKLAHQHYDFRAKVLGMLRAKALDYADPTIGDFVEDVLEELGFEEAWRPTDG